MTSLPEEKKQKERKEREVKKSNLPQAKDKFSPTLQKAVSYLTPFNALPQVRDIIELIQFIEKGREIVDNDFEKLRRKIIALNKITIKNPELSEVQHYTLLALTAQHPRNETDFATLDELDKVDPKYLVFTSSGYQFDIHSLINSHNGRTPRLDHEQYPEWSDERYLLNPYFNEPFNAQDVAHIQAFAQTFPKEEKISIKGKVLIPQVQNNNEAKALESKSTSILGRHSQVIEPLLSMISISEGRDPISTGAREITQFFHQVQDSVSIQPPLADDSKGDSSVLATEGEELHYYQKEILRQLREAKIPVPEEQITQTEALLRQNRWCTQIMHEMTIVYLMTLRTPRLSPDAAIAEIKGLNPNELYGLRDGLSREEVSGLNENQIVALGDPELRRRGLTAELLRNNPGFITPAHTEALLYLMIRRTPPLSAAAALEELKGLNGHGAEAIAAGIPRQEVLGLNNYQVSALRKLRELGLTSELLRANPWFNTFDHERALLYLMQERQDPLSAVDAMNALNGLDRDALDQLAYDNVSFRPF